MSGYKNCIDGIFDKNKASDMESVRRLLDILGNPQEDLRFVHIAGTNGKGSTAAYINNILIEAGYKTGLFTSPGIHSVNDRFRINNENIIDEELIEIAGYVRENADKVGSFCEFEMFTCVGFLYFQRHKCDIVILEAGIGGRLDTTNVIFQKEAAVITSVAMDHMDILGGTITQIAYEKAGIIKDGCDVICGKLCDDAKGIIEKVCCERNGNVKFINLDNIEIGEYSIERQIFQYKNLKCEIRLMGIQQIYNAVMAVETAEILVKKGYAIRDNDIVNGLRKTFWEGRMEVLRKNPVIILDGVHNTEGAEYLIENHKRYFGNKNRIFVVGMMKDKDCGSVLKILLQGCKTAIAAPVDNTRASDAAELKNIMKEYCQNSEFNVKMKDSIKRAAEICGEEDIIYICGSLYLINEVKNYFKAGENID